MKNLKKVLALGLALVMILGMFTVASAAETKTADQFSDWASVEHKDAFGLMVDLSIINGTDAGTLAPKDNINRASWAKMLYFVLEGDANANFYISEYPVLQDISGHWAQGYIEYLFSNAYISGDNNSNYTPDESITVAAAAKTMLTALGYDSKIQGYEGANWSNNVINDAKKNGLLAGIAQKQDEAISRDNAAQMVYNALSALTKIPETTLNFMTGEYVPSGKYEDGETLGYKQFGIVKVEADITGVDENGNATMTGAAVTNLASGVTKAVPSVEIPATAENVGTKGAFFMKASGVEFNSKGEITAIGSIGDLVSSRLIGDTSGVLKTSFAGAKFNTESSKVWDSKDKAYVGYAKDETEVNYYVDGESKDTTAVDVASGNKFELVDTDKDGDVDIVRITTYTVCTVDADPTVKTKDDKTTVTLKLNGESGAALDAGIVNGYADLAEGDVVLYSQTKTTRGGAVVAHTFEKVAKAVTGKVASFKDDTIRVAGTSYDKSGVAHRTLDTAWTAAQGGSTEYDFYLGKDGNVCYAVAVGEEASQDLVLVLDVTADNTGTGFNKGTTVLAKVLFVDGTKDEVKLASVKYAADGEAVEGSAIIGSSAGKFQEGEQVANVGMGFFTYKVNKDGNYELTADAKSATVTGATVDGTHVIGNATANNSTVYIIAVGDMTDDDTTYTVYTGYKNAPKLGTDGHVDAAVAYGEDGEAAKYVFIAVDTLDGATSAEMFFVPDHTDMYTDNENECRVLVAYNDEGDKVELKVVSETTLSKAGFYTVKSVSDDNVYTLDTAAVIDIPTGKAAKLAGGVLTIDDKFVAFDDATELKMITLDEDGAVSSYTTGKVEGSFETGEELEYNAMLGDGTAPAAAVTDAVDVVYVIVTPVAAD